jgi:drug/metabolite transporter (DMT)-like permease
MEMTITHERLWNWRQLTAKALAPAIGLLVLFLFFIGPIYIFRVSMGIPLDAEGPRGELWLLVLGIGLGNCAAYLGFYSILAKLGGFTKDQINAMWRDQ